MKNLLIAIPLLLAMGCTDYKQQALDLKKEKESLQVNQQKMLSDVQYKDSTINAFVSSFDEIQTSLADITQKQKAIKKSVNDNEAVAGSHQVIKEQLSLVKEMMEENKSKLATLTRQLKNNKSELAKFKGMIDALNEQTAVKDMEISTLNTRLNTLAAENTQLHTNVESLTAMNNEKEKTIADKTDRLNTAYFTKGTYKDLKNKHVIEKEGGLLGIGTEKVLPADFNRDEFTTIDITKTSKFAIDSKSAELVTNHPTDSYILNKTDNKTISELVITNPEKFWASSKYLVVVVN